VEVRDLQFKPHLISSRTASLRRTNVKALAFKVIPVIPTSLAELEKLKSVPAFPRGVFTYLNTQYFIGYDSTDCYFVRE
jgi:hypothetical protein